MLIGLGACAARADGPAAVDNAPAQFFTVAEPITTETIQKIRAATRQFVDASASAKEGKRPILVFEFRPGKTAPGQSEFGVCFDLANVISRDLAGAKLTIAYVPEPLQGYAVLPAVACTEIVMGPSATLGPITPEGKPYDKSYRELVRFLAIRKTRDPDLLLGMLDPEADLRLVRTADKTLHYVLAENLPAFQKSHQMIEERAAWEGGRRGTLTAKRAREEGFCKRTAESAAELAGLYQIAGHSVVDDPTLGQVVRPVWVPIEGPLTSVMVSYLSNRVQRAREEKANLLILQFNSPGGIDTVTDDLGDLIAGIKDMKTVAYIDDRALGLAALVPFACRDIVFQTGARMGDARRVLDGRGDDHDLSPGQIAGFAGKAELWARLRGHPAAVARAMVDPDARVIEAADSKTGANVLVLDSDLAAEPDRYRQVDVRKEAGSVLTLKDGDAEPYGLGRVVRGAEELKDLYGLHGKTIQIEGPGWVDSLVAFLTDPIVSWVLLFVGAFMMVVELKLPGVGLPGIMSALAFLLFFWSHYLSGTADQLEIIIFLVGLVCLAVELFVFPGFGVFGMSGVMLMLASIVMASHTFIWPRHDYEYRELGYTLIELMGMIFAVGVGVAVLARYFPSLPLFNRLVLQPEPWTGEGAALAPGGDGPARSSWEGHESLSFLIGETGRTVSPLRPTGKARFGAHQIDVQAVEGYVETDTLVEVIDVQGMRVTVRPV